MFKYAVLMIVAGVIFSSPLLAKEKVEKAVVADTAAKFAPLADSIRHQMDPGGRYEFIGPGDKRLVASKLDEMEALLTASGSVANMPEDSKIKLFNAQEQVNGILAHNASDRLVCEKVAPLGSHLPVTTCKTYGEIAKNRANWNKQFDRLGNKGRADAGRAFRGLGEGQH